jgi:sodium/hydrogen antiporter
VEPFEIAIIGVALFAFTIVSRRSETWPLTMPMVFVAIGTVTSATGIVEVAAELEAVGLLAEVTLAVILFSDSTRISLPRLRRQIGLPVRLLGIGLPLTIVFGTVLNWLLFPDWSIAQALLLAAILAPTDAALGSAVVEDESVPARDRLALNVESGLNDGMVVPVVALCTSLVLETGRSNGYWVSFVAQQIGYGVLAGLIVGFFGITVLCRSRSAAWSDGRYEQIATFALPVIAFCGAIAVNGNGFIAAFVAGLAFGSGGWSAYGHRAQSDQGPMAAEHFAEFTEDAAQLLGVITFFIFGNLFVGAALGDFGPLVIITAIASLTIVRIVPVVLSLTGTGMPLPTKLFIGWFGPRGLASIVFGILLLEELEELAEQADQLLGVISLTVTISVFVHGASASYGARKYGRWTDEQAMAHDADAAAAMPRPRGSASRPR